ncbi:MAG: ThuA domain-containing protein, partial [Planctomycetota bacterium]
MLLADVSLAVSPEELQRIENAAPAKAAVQPKRPRKLLVFNLCNDFKHSSIPYWDKALQIMGKKTGAYDVVISDRMAMFAPQFLNQYDAVCLNNTTKLDFSDEKLREGLMNFVKGGKGLIGIHAASDNFYDWPEGAEMIGAQFSGHPWTSGGTWAIKIDDPQHPLTAAFGGNGFKINDELYRTKPPLYSRSKQRVLLSLDMSDDATRNVKGFEPTDADTGISWVKSWGQGRVFYSSLGHNHHVVWTPAVLQHYLDGIQFALGDLPADTTPRSERPLDQLLADIARYEYGHSRLPLAEVDDLIRSASDSPEKLKEMEKSFVDFLASDATPAGKQFICRKLSVIGTKESVPTLAAMLTLKATSPIEPGDMARYALERMPGPDAGKALRDALPKTNGTVKVGIINSLGARSDREAVKQLSKLISDSNKQVAEAALSALGKIGGRQAAKTLGKAKSKVTPELRPVWADAYLMCADKFLAKGKTKPALKIYKQLY